MDRKLWTILIVGILLRIFLAAFTFHPDIRGFQLSGIIMGSGNILNFYDYLGTTQHDPEFMKVFPADLFIYPPAIYWFHGFWNFFFGIFFGSFVNSYLIDNARVFYDWAFNLHLLLVKIPYLIFDIPAAFLMMKLFETRQQKVWAFTLWMFNPVSLYATYVLTQFDVIPAFFTILALYYVKKDRYSLAALSLGAGIAFKIYPLFLLFPLAFMGKTYFEKVKLFLIGVIPYLVIISPYLVSRGYRSSALVAGQTLKSLIAAIPISGGEKILLFPLFMAFVYLMFFYIKGTARDLWTRFMIPLLIFFVFTHYHPQWFVWLTPFLIIDVVQSRFKHLFLTVTALGSFIGLLFFFDPSLTVWIFAPIWPGLYNLPSVFELMNRRVDDILLRSVLQTVFVAAAFVWMYIYFPRNHEEK